MRAKFNKAGYITKQIDGQIDSKLEIKGLINYSWEYIESTTEEKLKTNRVKLIDTLRFKE